MTSFLFAGQERLTRSQSEELANHGIRIEAGAVLQVEQSPGDQSDIPVIHIVEIGEQPWQDFSVLVCASDDKTVGLLLSQGIPVQRIYYWKNNALCPVDVQAGYSKSKWAGDWCELHDCHKGRRAFVLGNGPSLRVEDLDRLQGEITFASNKIYLAFDQTEWRPTYYTVADYLVAANNCDIISNLDLFALFPSQLEQFGCALTRGLWYEELFDNKFIDYLDEPARDRYEFFFSRDVRMGVQGGYTVIYHQLQLAYYMGIRELYLLGVDFFFNIPTKTVVDDRFYSQTYRYALESQGEVNHFHPDYRKPGEKWAMPRLDLQYQMFRTARQVFERDDGLLFNASRQTALTALERVCLEDVLAG